MVGRSGEPCHQRTEGIDSRKYCDIDQNQEQPSSVFKHKTPHAAVGGSNKLRNFSVGLAPKMGLPHF